MNNKILIILLIFIVIFIYLLYIFKNMYYDGFNSINNRTPINNLKCLISLSNYPQLQNLDTDIIKTELINIIKSNKWVLYDDFHGKNIFNNNNIVSLTKLLVNSQSILNSSKEPSWRLFPLFYNKQVLPEYDILCPNTIKMLLDIPYVINGAFSCLEAGKITDYHTDNNTKYFRFQLPLIIPEGDCKFKIVNQILDWSNPFIFDDNCFHQVWNRTKENRFVLILDILR